MSTIQHKLYNDGDPGRGQNPVNVVYEWPLFSDFRARTSHYVKSMTQTLVMTSSNDKRMRLIC